jgi:hypothetical protein
MGGHQDPPRVLLRASRACYADPVMASPERLLVPDTELSRPALVLAQRFVQRWDLYAHQIDDGSYVCIHEPLNVSHLFAHLRGEITLGAYFLSQESLPIARMRVKVWLLIGKGILDFVSEGLVSARSIKLLVSRYLSELSPSTSPLLRC